MKKYETSFSKIMKGIGLLEAKLIFWFPVELFYLLKVYSNNKIVLFNTFLTIFDRYLCDQYSKSNPYFKISYQTILEPFMSKCGTF